VGRDKSPGLSFKNLGSDHVKVTQMMMQSVLRDIKAKIIR